MDISIIEPKIFDSIRNKVENFILFGMNKLEPCLDLYEVIMVFNFIRNLFLFFCQNFDKVWTD